MKLDEALDILKDNSYILEKLEYSEDRYQYTPKTAPIDKLKKISKLRYGNDGYNYGHSGFGSKRLKDTDIKTAEEFKKLILNGGVYGKGVFKHKSVKNDLMEIVKHPEDYTHLFNRVLVKYGVDADTLKMMIEDDDSIDDAFDMCLDVYIGYLKKIFKDVFFKNRPIYRGIHLPNGTDPEEWIKKNKHLGTSWTIDYESAYAFADNVGADEYGCIITAHLDSLSNIDMTTSMLWWYKCNPFADYTNENEIRIRNSSKLKIEGIEKI
jgi:hypothetical protein